jgi:hypothetical protein
MQGNEQPVAWPVDLSVTVNTDRESTIGKAPSPEGTDLPGIGMLKAIAEAFSTVLKGLPKR